MDTASTCKPVCIHGCPSVIYHIPVLAFVHDHPEIIAVSTEGLQSCAQTALVKSTISISCNAKGRKTGVEYQSGAECWGEGVKGTSTDTREVKQCIDSG